MTKFVKISLPDDVASDAERAGLLAPEILSEILRRELARKGTEDKFFEIVEKLHALPDPEPMTPEQVADEIRAMRAERRKAATN
jgi:hypothetical protein